MKTGQNSFELRDLNQIKTSSMVVEKAFPSFFNISYDSCFYFLCLETKKVTISPKARQGKKNAPLFFCHEFSLLLSLFQDKESKKMNPKKWSKTSVAFSNTI